MKKLKIGVLIIALIIIGVNIYNKVHIGYEEYAYKVIREIITDEMSKETSEKIEKYIDKENLDEFSKIMELQGYPKIELPEKFYMSLLNDESSHEILRKGYYYDLGNWVEGENKNNNRDLLYEVSISRDTSSYPDEKISAYIIIRENNEGATNFITGRINVKLKKQGFNKYEIKDIEISNKNNEGN